MGPEDITEDNKAFVAKYGERKLRWFDYAHLLKFNPPLASISRIFAHAALALVEQVAGGPERTIALNLLVQAKDAACRGFLEGLDAKEPKP